MPVRLSNTSRLTQVDLYFLDDIEFWDMVDFPVIPARAGDLIHVVQDGDRIDLIAQRYYRNSEVWWPIASVNGLEIFPTDLKVGDALRIPDPDYVLNSLIRRRSA